LLREVGTQIQLSTVVKDLTGAAVNTPTLTMVVTKPDGTALSPAPTVTNTGSGGVYTAPVTPDQAGLWLYRWTAAGTVVSVQSDQFTAVASQRALVASMEEFKNELNRTDSFDDADLRSRLVAATDWAEGVIGGPLSVQTFTEQLHVIGDTIVPIFRPLVSVTSLTPDLGSAIDSTGYVVDTRLGVIRLRWLLGWNLYTLVYRAGLTVVSERIKEAGLIVAKHLWQTRNGGGGRQSPDDLVMSGLGFAVPRRAMEMVSKDNIPGIA
jgi:hypothetical protein